MSNDTQKADQIAHRLYTKLTLVVNHARATAEPNPQAKVDKWFNIETPDADVFKEHTRIYRSISSLSTPSSFQLHVLLCVPELTATQVLAYLSPDSSRLPIDPTPRYILLESWSIDFSPHPQQSSSSRASDDHSDVAPPTMYKHSISLFRSVFTLLRILPAWKLARRARRPGGSRNGNFTILVRVESEDGSRLQNTLGFDSLVQNTRLPKKTHDFPAAPHPKGSLSLSVTYLTSPDFKISDRESLLSSRFLSQDEGPEFTPTLLKNQQKDSLASSPGSLPMRTSLPRSPPSSVADRFVIPPPAHQRTTSLSGGSPRLQSVALPMSRAASAAGPGGTPGSVSGMSDTSSIRQVATSIGSREDLAPSAVAARLGRESFGAVRSESGAGPLPIRRPAPPPVNPFKSSTLSSGSPSLHSPSPSLRQHSPLSGAGPSLPSRPAAHSSPTSSRAPALPSPIGAGATGRLPSSPVTPLKPSPPLGPSSLGGPSSLSDRRSLEGVAGSTGDSSPRRRYVSSFNHRYSASGVGSAGSSSSGVTQAERIANASYLSSNTDDDDISDFVKQIDTRKPLGSRRDQGEQGKAEFPRGPPDSPPPSMRPDEDPPAPRSSTLASAQPVVVSADAVDERLRKMNETFLASLEGLGTRRRERSTGTEDAESSNGSTTVRAPSSGPSTLGRRTVPLDARTFAHRREDSDESSLMRRPSTGSTSGSAAGYGIPPLYIRPRLLSTGSTRSGVSATSEEVIGRMDPEIDDGRRRSRSAGFM